MLVKADFPAIVTEEEWYQCEKIRKSRRADLNIPTTRKTPFGEEKVTKPVKESHDLWNKRLRCTEGFCDMEMIADWKLEAMCKRLLEEVWQNRKEAILKVEGFLKECYQSKTVSKSDTAIIIGRIERTKQKLSNLIDMRTEGDISIEEYRKRKMDFSKPKIDNEIVDKFIARITPLGDNRFAWFVNVSGASTEEIDMMVEGRKNHANIRIDDE